MKGEISLEDRIATKRKIINELFKLYRRQYSFNYPGASDRDIMIQILSDVCWWSVDNHEEIEEVFADCLKERKQTYPEPFPFI